MRSSGSYRAIKFEFLERLIITISAESTENDGFVVLFYDIPQLYLVPR